MTTKLPEVGKRYRTQKDFHFLKKGHEVQVLEINLDTKVVKFDAGFDTFSCLIFSFRKHFEELPDQPTEEKPMKESKSEVDKALEELKSALNHVYDRTEFAAIDWRNKAQNLVNALETEKEKERESKNKIAELVSELEVMEEKHLEDFHVYVQELSKKISMSKPKPRCTCGKVLPESGNSAFCSEECSLRMYNNKESEPKSIWKPVSELPYLPDYNDFQSIKCLVRFLDGSIQNGYITNSGVFTDPTEKPRKRDDLKEFTLFTDYINNIEERLSKLENNNN